MFLPALSFFCLLSSSPFYFFSHVYFSEPLSLFDFIVLIFPSELSLFVFSSFPVSPFYPLPCLSFSSPVTYLIIPRYTLHSLFFPPTFHTYYFVYLLSLQSFPFSVFSSLLFWLFYSSPHVSFSKPLSQLYFIVFIFSSELLYLCLSLSLSLLFMLSFTFFPPSLSPRFLSPFLWQTSLQRETHANKKHLPMCRALAAAETGTQVSGPAVVVSGQVRYGGEEHGGQTGAAAHPGTAMEQVIVHVLPHRRPYLEVKRGTDK